MTKRQKKRPPLRKQTQPGPIVGVAWYIPEQWDRMKAVAVDAESMDDTHSDWLKNAGGHVRWLKEQGFQVVEVPIDIDEWVAWCQANGKALDGAARSEFASYKLSKGAEASSSSGQYVSRHIKPRRNPIPFLDMLETAFEAERDKSIPPLYPFDKTLHTIRLPREIEAHLRQLARTGQKIAAVRLVTKLTGAGLRVAKDYVDSLSPAK